MTRPEVIEIVRARLEGLEAPEEREARAKRTYEDFQVLVLGARLRAIVNDPNTGGDTRAIAQEALELLENHFG